MTVFDGVPMQRKSHVTLLSEQVWNPPISYEVINIINSTVCSQNL